MLAQSLELCEEFPLPGASPSAEMAAWCEMDLGYHTPPLREKATSTGLRLTTRGTKDKDARACQARREATCRERVNG